MCLPYLKEKAESFSDCIVSNTPNALIVVNDALEVQQINPAALKILNIRHASDILGDQVVRILEPKPFLEFSRASRASATAEHTLPSMTDTWKRPLFTTVHIICFSAS